MTFYDPKKSKPKPKCDFKGALQMKSSKVQKANCEPPAGIGSDCYFTCAWAKYPPQTPPKNAACYGGRQGGGWGGGESTVDYFSVANNPNDAFPTCCLLNNPNRCP